MAVAVAPTAGSAVAGTGTAASTAGAAAGTSGGGAGCTTGGAPGCRTSRPSRTPRAGARSSAVTCPPAAVSRSPADPGSTWPATGTGTWRSC